MVAGQGARLSSGAGAAPRRRSAELGSSTPLPEQQGLQETQQQAAEAEVPGASPQAEWPAPGLPAEAPAEGNGFGPPSSGMSSPPSPQQQQLPGLLEGGATVPVGGA
jgi:hypothetical protein